MTAAHGTVPRIGRARSGTAGISRNVAVIGHNGRMGAMLAQRLGSAGHKVFGADRELRTHLGSDSHLNCVWKPSDIVNALLARGGLHSIRKLKKPLTRGAGQYMDYGPN
ncbi:MAG: hypothetical protein LBO64_06240 [Desulfovibrio sp.]|jgi:nucleoside-diphosphate-sugar epimerase|nr:hypothetical protein [Desulfovibrio sp.]